MPLTPGTRLGVYEVTAKIGEGGMGEVYRATDTRLKRQVAIKILPPSLAADPDRLARFQREAEVLASVNHPNIAGIYGLEESGGMTALVMELVEGDDLSQRIARGAIPVDEALPIAKQIADAVEAAHDQGIIHRDLKPANIKITTTGLVKVLDFGLAKVVGDLTTRDTASRTTSAMTREGVILGTPAYMSPEQALGSHVDRRTDIWSFGCVLFEMLSGTKPFGDGSPSSAALIRDCEPNWNALPSLTPRVRRLLIACLQKDYRRRLQDIAEVLTTLEQEHSKSADQSRRQPATAFLALLAVVVFGGLVLIREQLSTHRVVESPVQLTDFNDSAIAPSLSRDGRMLAFIRGGTFGDAARHGQVYVKILPAGEPVQLTGDAFPKEQPAFSPDGARIVFGSLMPGFKWDSWQVPVLGGLPELFLPNASGLVWVDDRQLMYSEITSSEHMGIVTSKENRSEHRPVYFPPGEAGMAHRSALSPDHRWVLIVEMDARGDWLPCRLVPFDGSSVAQPIGPPAGQCTSAAWSPDGKWMYFSSNAADGFHIWRQRFPNGISEQLTFGPTEQEGTAITNDGKYLVTSMGTQLATVWLHDSEGERQLTSEAFAMLPTLTPAGDRIYYLVRSPSVGTYPSGELWSISLATGQRERSLPGRIMSGYSISPDGKKVVFTGVEGEGDQGVWIADLDRRSPPRRLTNGAEFRAFFGTPGEIVYMKEGQTRYLHRVNENGSGDRRVWPNPVTNLVAVSPDGRWAVVLIPQQSLNGPIQTEFVSLHDDKAFPLCNEDCAIGFGPARIRAPLVNWSYDKRFLYVGLQYFGHRTARTVILPYRSDLPFEQLYPNGLSTEADVPMNPGATVVNEADVFPAVGSSYVTWRRATQSNLYRISLPH